MQSRNPSGAVLEQSDYLLELVERKRREQAERNNPCVNEYLNKIQNIYRNIYGHDLPDICDSDEAMTEEANKSRGNLPTENVLDSQGKIITIGYNCKLCKNRGIFYRYENGIQYVHNCKCITTRNNLQKLLHSGLYDLSKNYTFANFSVDEPYQQQMMQVANEFLADKNRKWMFVSGQTGCGKTHICTAVAVKMMRSGAKLRYITWADEIQRLEAEYYDSSQYECRMRELTNVQILYIDDLFKTKYGEQPTKKQFDIGFQIINSRYIKRLCTIISTEYSLRQLGDIDNALAGRIAEMAKNCIVQIEEKSNRNYRAKFFNKTK